jgi:hypothetical protein
MRRNNLVRHAAWRLQRMQGHFPLGPRAPGGTAAHAAAGRTQRSERRVQCFACSSRRPPVRAGLLAFVGVWGKGGNLTICHFYI